MWVDVIAKVVVYYWTLHPAFQRCKADIFKAAMLKEVGKMNPSVGVDPQKIYTIIRHAVLSTTDVPSHS